MTMFAGLDVGFKRTAVMRSGWGWQECLAGSCGHPSGGDCGGIAQVAHRAREGRAGDRADVTLACSEACRIGVSGSLQWTRGGRRMR